jgi:hypothetical protein
VDERRCVVSFEEDPEVVADLKLRAATERDRSRSREMPAFVPPKFKGKVPCRGRCGGVVDWTEDAEERFEMFNRILKSKMEAPLDKTLIVFCEKCKSVGLAAAAAVNLKKVEVMAKLIRELKTKSDPPGETEILEKLKKLDHPDIPGLLISLRDKAITGKQPRKPSRNSL